MKADVIIPTYRPDKQLFKLLDSLNRQSQSINKIIIMNTEQQFFETLIIGSSFWKKYGNVTVKHITQKEFNHGRTRNCGVKYSEAEFFIMMTQDAMPADEFLIEKLLSALNRKQTAIAYARHMPGEDSGELEKFARRFNYPDVPDHKTKADVERLGIKAFFASNVCAAYNRDIFDQLEGFASETILNEDMIYAYKAINAGYAVAYEPEAKVIHSHNYSNKQQFQRNFDLGVSHADFPQVFGAVSSESEGFRMIKKAINYLFKIKKPWLIIKLMMQSGCKYLGYFIGKRYRKLPEKWIIACSMNKQYWKNN